MNTIFARTRTNAAPPPAEIPGESHAANRLLNSAQGEIDRRKESGPARAPGLILVPLTLSGDPRPALAIAGNLARKSRGRLVLLHVVQLNIVGEERGIQRARLLEELAGDAETQLRELAGGMDGPAGPEVLVCHGNPAEAIVETARRLRADAIVMRLHGRRGWRRWLHRNTALNVARQAPCRIWLVHQSERALAILPQRGWWSRN